ncbi:methyltransferase domain-containing protein [Nocardia sp. NPDC048505]|uniref:class I SAM-dependent methyltransferase n=1 Tax=unclassified Nocardia TaxID=2637762 RepID=UPI0033C3AC0E
MTQAPDRDSAWFRDQRDFWWNEDFLALLAARWRLPEARSLADIGCGLGHWARLLYPHLAPEARLLGVDCAPEWLRRARLAFEAEYPEATTAGRVDFRRGDVLALDIADDAFDVVTCQTLLMHLDDPARGLREMIRVTKPGGLVLCVEPSNLFNLMAFDSRTPERPTAALVRDFEFWLRFQRGRVALGKGDLSVGEQLPGMFAQAGLAEVRVYLRDTAFPVFSPYAGPEQQATLEPTFAWETNVYGPWDHAQLRRYFLAGGGSPELLEAQLAAMREEAGKQRMNIAENSFHSAGGATVYIVGGRKS